MTRHCPAVKHKAVLFFFCLRLSNFTDMKSCRIFFFFFRVKIIDLSSKSRTRSDNPVRVATGVRVCRQIVSERSFLRYEYRLVHGRITLRDIKLNVFSLLRTRFSVVVRLWVYPSSFSNGIRKIVLHYYYVVHPIARHSRTI